MKELRQQGKLATYLGAGLLLGIGSTLGFQLILAPADAARAAGAGSPRLSTVPSPSLAEAPDAAILPLPQPGKDPRHAARSATDWERVAAQYQAVGGDPSLARSLMLRLDKKALRRLAADAATWPRSRRNERILGEIFHRWGELDFSAALAQAQSLPPDLADRAVRESLDGYVESDPAGACAFLAAPTPAGAGATLRSEWIHTIRLGQALENWAEQDAAAAVAFVSRLPRNSYKAYVLDDVAREWMRQDPAAALNWAQGLNDHNQRSSALNGVLTTWAQTDPTAAANYVFGLSGNPDQDDLLKNFLGAWATQDQAAAAQWVTRQNGGVQSKAAAAVAAAWANFDPQAAVNWSNQFPAGDTRNTAWGAIAREWYVNDAASTVNWLQTLPVGDGRDAAIAGTAEYWMLRNQPTETLGLVAGINDPQRRADTQVKVLNTWLSHDAIAARQWIGQAGLPEIVTGKLKGS